MKKFEVPVEYTAVGEISVEANNYEEAVAKAEKLLAVEHSMGSVFTGHNPVSWLDSSAEVDGEEIDLDDFKYFEED